MDNRALLATGAGAIALFAVGAIALLWVTGDTHVTPTPRDGASPAGAPGGAASAPVTRPAPARPPDGADRGSAAGTDAAGGSSTASGPRAQTPEDVDPSWRDARIAFRVRELGAVAPYVGTGLRYARGQMDHCFGGERRDPAGTAPMEPGAGGTPPVLLLYLEAREGAIDVVDVRIDDLGTESREVVECCRGVLRGHEIRAPTAVPGRRYRLQYRLQ